MCNGRTGIVNGAVRFLRNANVQERLPLYGSIEVGTHSSSINYWTQQVKEVRPSCEGEGTGSVTWYLVLRATRLLLCETIYIKIRSQSIGIYLHRKKSLRRDNCQADLRSDQLHTIAQNPFPINPSDPHTELTTPNASLTLGSEHCLSYHNSTARAKGLKCCCEKPDPPLWHMRRQRPTHTGNVLVIVLTRVLTLTYKRTHSTHDQHKSAWRCTSHPTTQGYSLPLHMWLLTAVGRGKGRHPCLLRRGRLRTHLHAAHGFLYAQVLCMRQCGRQANVCWRSSEAGKEVSAWSRGRQHTPHETQTHTNIRAAT